MCPYKRCFVLTIICFFYIHFLICAPINNNTALTPAKGEWIIREQFRYTKMKTDDCLPVDQKINIVAIPNVALYGVTGKFNVLFQFPLIHKRLEVFQNNESKIRKVFGFGDLLVIGKYRIYAQDKVGGTTRVGLFAGLEFPTGDHSAGDRLGEFPRPFQLGSGSWDPLIGAVFTTSTLKYQWDIVAQYKFNTEGHGFEFGDIFRHDLSFQYRIWPEKLTKKLTKVPSFVNFVLEANGIFRRKNRNKGVLDTNSGGYILFISPGIQYVKKRFIAEISVQIPAVQRLNGVQPEHKFIFVLGIRAQF